MLLSRAAVRDLYLNPLPGHPPPKWEQQLQTRITNESIRDVLEISGRTNGFPEQLYTKTQ